MDDGLVNLAESGILEMGNAVSVTGDADGSHGPFLCLSFMREGEHLCLFAFRVRLLSQHRRKRMLRRAALPLMRNRAPSTRIGAARDPGPVSPPSPSVPRPDDDGVPK